MAHYNDSQTAANELIPESEPLWFIDAEASRRVPNAGASARGTRSSEFSEEKLQQFRAVTTSLRAALTHESLMRSNQDQDERNKYVVQVVFKLLGELEQAFQSLTGQRQIIATLKTLARPGFFKCTHSSRVPALRVVDDIPVEGSLAGDVFTHGEPLVLHSWDDPRMKGSYEESSRRDRLNSGIFVPVVVNDIVVGVLAVESPAKDDFDESHVAIVAHAADAIGIVFQVANFFETLRLGDTSNVATTPLRIAL